LQKRKNADGEKGGKIGNRIANPVHTEKSGPATNTTTKRGSGETQQEIGTTRREKEKIPRVNEAGSGERCGGSKKIHS